MEDSLVKRSAAGQQKAFDLNLKVTKDYFESLIRYDAETGKLWWRRPDGKSKSWGDTGDRRLSRYGGKEAFGCLGANGYYVGSILSVPCYRQDAVWFLHHGYWPDFKLEFIDGDSTNTRIENIRPWKRRRPLQRYQKRSRWQDSFADDVFELNYEGNDILWKADSLTDPVSGDTVQFQVGEPAFTKRNKEGLWYVKVFDAVLMKHRVGYWLHHGEELEGSFRFLNNDTSDISPDNMIKI